LKDAFARAGHKYLPDQNGLFEDGYFPITISNANEQRVSASIGYLNAEVRNRPNLTISTHTQITELLFEGGYLRHRASVDDCLAHILKATPGHQKGSGRMRRPLLSRRGVPVLSLLESVSNGAQS
jgi:hypothetical protein